MAQDAPSGYGVRIERCPGLNEMIAKRSPENELTWDQHEIEVSSIDALSAKLWSTYGDTISAGEYTKAGGWHKFSRHELADIRRLRETANP